MWRMLQGKFLRIDEQDEKLLIIKVGDSETVAVPLTKALEDALAVRSNKRVDDERVAVESAESARPLSGASSERGTKKELAHARVAESRISEDISGGQGLTPREIQQQIRSGLSEEEIAHKFEVPIEKVKRYSLQVRREKILIIDQFMHLSARSAKRGRTLVDVVNEYFDFCNIDRLDVHWNATKNEHKPWVIQVEFELEGKKTVAIWTWDPKLSIISESNEVARKITKYYEDAAFDDEPIFLGLEKKNKTVTPSSEEYHTVSFSTGLRLKELLKSFDADFQTQTAKQIIDTSYQNINPDYSGGQRNEVESLEHEDTDQAVEPTESQTRNRADGQVEDSKGANGFRADITSRPVLSILNLAASEKGDAHQNDDTDESAVPNFGSFVTPIGAEKEDTHTDSVNITGRMREKLAKKRKTRTKVPSWDEVMFPKSDGEQDDDLPTAA